MEGGSLPAHSLDVAFSSLFYVFAISVYVRVSCSSEVTVTSVSLPSFVSYRGLFNPIKCHAMPAKPTSLSLCNNLRQGYRDSSPAPYACDRGSEITHPPTHQHTHTHTHTHKHVIDGRHQPCCQLESEPFRPSALSSCEPRPPRPLPSAFYHTPRVPVL